MKNILNEKGKRTWFENNYFWACTAGFIVLNIILYAIVGPTSRFNIPLADDPWYDTFYFNSIIASFLNTFRHLGILHIVLNMLCFLVIGLYLERKMGTVRFCLLVLAMAFFTSAAITANNLSIGWAGFSGVMYALYAYVIIDFIFMCRAENKCGKIDMILGGVLLGFIYIAMCYNSKTESFNLYPSGLTNNLGHYTSFIVGIIMTFMIKIAQFKPKPKQ